MWSILKGIVIIIVGITILSFLYLKYTPNLSQPINPGTGSSTALVFNASSTPSVATVSTFIQEHLTKWLSDAISKVKINVEVKQ